ncbi:MAG TPA: NlpC/P60 family protein [Micromonosporaceae bacterium]
MRPARQLLRGFVLGIVAVGLIAPATVAEAAPSISDIQQQIQKSSSDLEKIVEQYDKTTEDLKHTQAAAAALKQKMAPLQTKMDAARANVGQLAATAYMGGSVGTMSALLGSGSTDQLIDQLNSLDQLAKARQSEISAYKQAAAQYNAEKTKLDDTLAQQTAQQKDLAAKKATIQSKLNKLYEMRRQAYGTATVSASSTTSGSAPAVSGRAGIAVRYAYGALGKPYVWAAAGPNGYDCSGLTMAAWGAAGVSLPHNAAMQWNQVAHISRSSLQPGDLVFYENLGHVAIYVGSGKVIHAPTFGDVVKVSSVDMMPPYGYGRVG